MVTIRKTKSSDLKILGKIYKRSYDATHSGEMWSYVQAVELINFYYHAKTFIGLTVLYDNKICGAFLSFIKPWWDGKHLAEGELFIDPRYQGKKIGTQLYLAMMKFAYKRGCVVHDLLAYKSPSFWYRKIGFRVTELIHMSGKISRVIKIMSAK